MSIITDNVSYMSDFLSSKFPASLLRSNNALMTHYYNISCCYCTYVQLSILKFLVKNKEESANGNLAIIDNGQTAKLFSHQLKATERTAVVDAATVD